MSQFYTLIHLMPVSNSCDVSIQRHEAYYRIRKSAVVSENYKLVSSKQHLFCQNIIPDDFHCLIRGMIFKSMFR